MIRLARAGPGPSTLASRLRQHDPASLTAAPFVGASRLACTKFKSKPAPKRAQPTPKTPPVRSLRHPVRDTHAPRPAKKAHESPADTHTAPNVIALPPPKSLASALPYLKAMRHWIAVRNGTKVLDAWSNIMRAGLAPVVPDEDYALLSRHIVTLLTPPGRWHIDDLIKDDSERFGALRDAALEAAARDHWDALHELLLCLVEVARPEDVLRAGDEYRRRWRAVRAIDKTALHSPSRDERVAARLDGAGPRALVLSYIAAMTMLDRLTSDQILCAIDMSPSRRYYSTEVIAQVQRRLLLLRGGAELQRRFRVSLEKVDFGMACYHPKAMRARIQGMADMKQMAEVEQLYNGIMGYSIGPDKFIHPLSLDDRTRISETIPLTAALWRQFIIAFHAAGNHERVVQIIDQDMPARGITPDAHMLAIAMRAHTLMAMNKSIPASDAVRAQSMARAEALWDRIVENGWSQHYDVVSSRLVLLHVSGRGAESEDYYLAAKKHFPPGRGWSADFAFAHILLMRGQHEAALAFLDSESTRSVKYLERLHTTLLQTIVLRLRLSHAQKKQLIVAILKRRVPHQRLRNEARGLLLRFMVTAPNCDIAKTVRGIVNDLYSDVETTSQHWWLSLNEGLLSRTSTPSVPQVRAALELLAEYTRRPVKDESVTGLLLQWRMPLRAIALSTAASSALRHDLLQRAVDLYRVAVPSGEGVPALRRTIIDACFHRDDTDGVQEAYGQWRLVRSTAQEIMWTTMLFGLHKHGYLELARELAWDTAKYAAAPRAAKTSTFFKHARQLGILTQAEQDEIASLPVPAAADAMVIDDDDDDGVFIDDEADMEDDDMAAAWADDSEDDTT